MAIRVIDDTKLQNIAVAIQSKDNGGQMTVDDMPTRIANIPTGGTLIPKTITGNGVYNASSDNADGYDVVTVDVPQDPYEVFDAFASGTIQFLKSNAFLGTDRTAFPISRKSNNESFAWRNIQFISFKNSGDVYFNIRDLLSLRYLKYIRLGIKVMEGYILCNAPNLKSLVITSTSVAVNQNSSNLANSGISSGIGFVWVYDSLVSGYQSATNWSVYASQIKGFSEAPIFDNSVTYSIGDVCQYNGRFYGYCKKNLTSSTGNPPTGTTADNDYWEYVADIEVI